MTLPRYTEYKDSGSNWIGSIPSHWARRRLKTLLADSDDALKIGPFGSQLTSEMLTAKGFKVYGQENVIAQDFLERGTRFISSEKFAELAVYAVRPGDVLISMMGSSGKCAIVPQGAVAGVMDSHLLRLRLGREVLPVYVQRLIDEAGYVAHQVAAFGKGSIMHGLNSGIVKSLQLALPPLAEQAAIATFLGRETAKIDALIAEQEELIALLAEKRQATISHAVTRGLDPNVPMKDSGVTWLGEVPGHWEVRPIKAIARVGNGSTPNRDNPDYWAVDGFPWLNSSVVNQEEVTEATRFVTERALQECHLPIVEPPAVLVGITGQGRTRGMAAQLAFTATVNQHLAYIKPRARAINIDFLLRVLDSAYEHLRTESDGAGSTKGAITCDQLSRLRIPVPNAEEQSAITAALGEKLRKLDDLTADAQRSTRLLNERRSALISAAVTGQIDVRGAVPQSAAQEEIAA